MEINITRTDPLFKFLANNGGSSVSIVASPELSQTNQGFRPMQLLLASLGSCMSIDVLQILTKQKQEPVHFQVMVRGDRTKSIPSVFESITLEFLVDKSVDELKLAKAIQLSRDKYCSVFRMLSPAVHITTTYRLLQ